MNHFKMLIFVSFLALCQATNKLQEADDVVEYDSVIIDTRVNGEDRGPRSDSACQIYRGRYIAAGDNADQSTSKANLQECANWCAEIPACRAWTFNSDEMRCWLKLSDGEKGCPDGDCEKSPWVSGTKSCGANTDGRLLLLSSDGEAGDERGGHMGLYSLMEGVTHNKMPVWIRDLKDMKLFYSKSGYWMFGAEPESDAGFVTTVATGLASPLLGVVSGWEYFDAGWHTDKLLSVKAIALPTYPEEVTVSSYGPAKEVNNHVMGVYTMTWARQHKRPVWQKVQDNSLFLFYTGGGSWMIGGDRTENTGWIMSGRRGLLHLPEGGWKYGYEGAWSTDDTTLTIANTVSG